MKRRSTKHHRMQVPFLQHWRGWKDVLFGRVAFENNVYKPYSYYINVALRDHQRRHVVVTESLPAFAMVLGYLLKVPIRHFQAHI